MSFSTNAFSSRSAVCLALLGAAALSSAGLVANFDDRTEGEWFDMFSNGSIRFHDVTTYGGGYTNFTIEDASSGFLGAGLSAPNVLGYGAYVPGPNMAFGGIKSFWFTSDTVATTAGLDIWTFQGEAGLNTLTLRGYRAGQIVQTVAFSFDFSPTPIHRRLDLPIDAYDHFELFSSGPAHGGDSCIDVDNVTVGIVPEPASLAVLGLGAGALLRRRRR